MGKHPKPGGPISVRYSDWLRRRILVIEMTEIHVHEVVDYLNKNLPGKRIEKAKLGIGSFMFLNIEKEIPILYPSGKTEMRSPWIFWFYMCNWRVLSKGLFFVGGETAEPEIHDCLACLDGRKIIRATINPSTYDLKLFLDGEFIVETFSVMKDPEQWKIFCDDGLTYTLGSNGEICHQQ